MSKLSVASDFSKTPGGRYAKEGPYSGEHFREDFLKPAYLAAIKSGETLTIDLDGGYGYGSSFLEEAFGGLARELKDPCIRNIKFISNEEPGLIPKVIDYINNGLKG